MKIEYNTAVDDILKKLSAGDMRTTGASDEIVRKAFKNHSLINILIRGLENHNPAVRMRSADALEKIGAKKPRLLQPFKDFFLSLSGISKQQEVQWHLAQIISYLKLSPSETELASRVLLKYLRASKSNIVKVFSLTSLAYLSGRNVQLKKKVIRLLKEAMQNGAPSIRCRAKKLWNNHHPF